MDFEIDQVIAAPVSGVLEALADPDFYRALGSLPNLGQPEVLERTTGEAGAVALRVRFAYVGDVAPALRRVVSPEKLSWVTTTTVHPDAGRVDFSVVPEHYPGRLAADGTYELSEVAPGTRRLVQGSLTVRLPLLGSTAERAVVAGFRRHLEAEADLLVEWLVA